MSTEKKGSRGSVLHDAHSVINGERQDQYGAPEDSFGLIAERWNQHVQRALVDALRGYFGGDDVVSVAELLDVTRGSLLRPRHVALMMADMKLARELNGHKRDNLVDLAGYTGIAADLSS